MENLETWQYAATALIFVWTGFVRSGLGFGGAALGLPLLLLVVDDPLIWIPLIGVHLLFFSGITVGTRLSAVDWSFLKKAFGIMIIPKMVGVFGLLTLPTELMVTFVYIMTLLYGVMYLFKYQLKSQSNLFDGFLLVIGGYVSGTSLIGAPLIVAVFMHRVAKEELRNTLFVLWFVLVTIKLSVLGSVGVDFWWIHHLWLLPAAAIGHVVGLRLHDYLISQDAGYFKQTIGAILIVICLIGLMR
ncbi:MAG TPA: sulfite exporter TauE/SafE family protein [Ghiorsea sp.]|nr:sulfite exporter TauE/SafE family protein [Ghiorsea sp.]